MTHGIIQHLAGKQPPEDTPHGCPGRSVKRASFSAAEVGIISNPLSGGNKKGLKPVEKMLSGHNRISHHIAVRPEEVMTACRDFARRGVDIIVVNGGDGTIHASLTALFTIEWPDAMPALALLRAGTTSMIARDVGLPGSRLQGLSRFVDWVRTGRGKASFTKRPVLKLTRENCEQPMYGMFFGAGGIYEGIKFCHARIYSKGLGGEIAAGLTLARFLIAGATGNRQTAPSTLIRMDVGEATVQKMNALFLFATTLDRLFLGMRPYWGTGSAPLHVTTIRSGASRLLLSAPTLMRSRRNRWTTPRHGYISRNLHALQLYLESGFTLDGQLYDPDPRFSALKLECGGEAEFLKI